MRINKKRTSHVLAMLLTLVMLLGMLPGAAFAAEPEVWSVPVQMMNASHPEKESMGNQAIDGNATVTLSGKNAEYAIDFHGIAFSGLYGHLLNLWDYEDYESDSSNEAARPAVPSGEYEDTNLSGETDSFYRTFTISRSNGKEDQFYIRISVDAMDGFDQDALLIFDWDSADLVSGGADPEPAVNVTAASAALTADDELENGKAVFTLSLDAPQNISAIEVSFTANGTVNAEGQSNFSVLGVKNGVATLVYLNDGQFSASGEKDVVRFTVTTDKSEATLKITDLKIAGRDASGTEVYGTIPGGISPNSASVQMTETPAETTAKPVISPNGGSFTKDQKVTITCKTLGAKIYYTTDGSTPSESSKLYKGPFTVNKTTTVKAVAIAAGMKLSAVASAKFTKDNGGGGGGGDDAEGIEDGKYYVDIDLWHETKDQASMGNRAFENNNKALVTVKNGKVTTVEMATNPVNMSGIVSAVIEVRIGGIHGTPVKVLETGKVTTNAGNAYDYVKRCSFKMPAEGQPDDFSGVTYVKIAFRVPDTPMDSVAEDGFMTARLKFNWSTAKATDDGQIEGSDEIGADNEAIHLLDKATGIKLDASTNELPLKVQLSVKKPTSGKDYDNAVKAMSTVKDKWTLYKITTLDKTNKEIQPDGSVTISIPCNASGLTIYRISDTGRKIALRGSVKDGYYVFNTSSLGLFAVIGQVPSEVKPESGFVDVPDNYWAKDAIDTVVKRGLFAGTTKTTFSPEAPMTRAMFVTVLGRLAGVDPNGPTDTPFKDVPNNVYAPYISWAVKNGVAKGTTAETFTPDRSVNRQEMAAFLARYCKVMGIELKHVVDVTFKDEAAIDNFAKEPVAVIAAAGLLKGTGNGMFSPRATATRAQVATMLSRFINEYKL